MIKYILKNYSKNLIIITIFSIICAFLSLMLPDILANIISKGIGSLDKTVIYSLGIKLIILSVLIFAFSILSSYFSNRLGAKIGYDLRNKLYQSTLNLDLNNINNFGVSSLIVRNTADINQIENMVSLLTKSIIYAFVLGIGGIFKAFFTSRNLPALTSVVIICILITAISLYLIFVTVVPKYDQLQTILDKINERFQEVLNGLLIIKANNQEEFEYKKSQKYNEAYVNLEYFLNRIMSTLAPFVNMILSACSVGIIYIMFKKAINLNDVANMIAFSEYATQVISSFLALAMCFIMLPKAKTSYKRIIEVINSYNNIYDDINAKDLNSVNNITFKKASYTYPGSSEASLKNVNLNINKGETVVIIGSTGSGKSTLVNLLNRFYDVSDGEIVLNNTDIRKIKLKSLNENIATVFQNEFLMRGNIKDIMFTKDSKRIKKVFEITNLTNIDEISFNGENLSGGQKQRLCIARALLKNSPVLVLDDAFSAVDYSTENDIIKNIKKEYPKTIKIIITSRVSSVKFADKIIVLDNGKIVGTGNHKDLLKTCDLYKTIYNLATVEVNHE